MGKKLDSGGLSTVWGIIKSFVNSKLFGGVPLSTGSRYAVCATEGGVAEKTVTIDGFTLSVGAEVLVRFTNANTASVSSLTLNVSNTGAKAIRHRNAVLSSASTIYTNYTYAFVYDGTYWQLEGGVDTDTTYLTGTSTLLDAGTDTNDRVWSAKVLSDFFDGISGGSSIVTSITRSGTTFTAKNADGDTLFTFTQQDNNTTYSAGTKALFDAGTNTTSRVWSPSVLKSIANENVIKVIESSSELSPTTTYPKNTLIRIGGVTLLSNTAATIPDYVVFEDGDVVLDDDFTVTDAESSDPNWDIICGIVMDTTPSPDSSNAVTSNGVYLFARKSIISITRSGTTFTAHHIDGTTSTFTQQDNNTTYTPASLGFGYGTCATAADTTAKVVTLSNYVLMTGGYVTVKFTYAVPASATMNINSKGGKPIYYKGSAISANIIQAGDTATFVYNGSQYVLLSIDTIIDLLTSLRGKNVVYET